MDKPITRREFLKRTALVGGGALIYASGCVDLFPVKEESTTTTIDDVGLKEAMYYETLGKEIVRCQLCPNGCAISKENRGICGVRINKHGKLYTYGYGNPCAANNDPIEKKPLYHFLPESYSYSIATAGCSMRCKFCQNWQISQSLPDETRNQEMSPEEVVKKAKENKAESIAYTYTEPTVFYEYMTDTAKTAHKEGLRNIIVTCGYINEDPLRELCRHLDGGNVNLKMFSDKVIAKLSNGLMQPILDSIVTLKEEKIWLEITYLLIPGWSDDEDQINGLLNWMDENVGLDVPLHFLRFMPAHKMRNVAPTPLKTMERAYQSAKDKGFSYVYLGNVSGTGKEDTYCPQCEEVLINRRGFLVEKNSIVNGKCPFCGREIDGCWK